MVFQELLGFWRSTSTMKHIFANFDDMLLTSKGMFEIATEALFAGESDLSKVHVKLVKMDSRLNTLQQVIRRDIITHVAVQGTQDIVPCLVMMSITKDAERLGDYAKNISEVAEHCPPITRDPLFQELKTMQGQILSWFDKTTESFEKSDKDLARATREEAYSHEKKCDKLIWGLSENNEGRNAVAPALLLRFFKRTAAHLGNILTTVVMPFDKIDYYDKNS